MHQQHRLDTANAAITYVLHLFDTCFFNDSTTMMHKYINNVQIEC